MKLRPLLDLLRRPAPRPAPALWPPDPAGPGEDSVYLSEPPAPGTDRESDWCVWPDEIGPAVPAATDAAATAARDARLADAVAARLAALDAAWARSEDPWAVLHAQHQGTTPAG